MYHILIHIDQSELKLLKMHNRRAFERLYDSASSHLFGLALKIAGRKELAEDILHDAFIKIWNNIQFYDEDKASILTWMSQIVRNTAIDVVRNKHFQHIHTDDFSVYIQNEPSAIPQIDHIGIKDLLSRLKPEYVEVIDILYYRGYTHEEAAQALGIPLGTLKTRARAAITELKLIFKQR